MSFLPGFDSLRQLTRRAWQWLRHSMRLRQAAAEIERRVQNPSPGTQAVLLSGPVVSDADWMAALRRRMAEALEFGELPAFSPADAERLLQWRREAVAQFEQGGWMSELTATVQPGMTLCAHIRERGVIANSHALLIQPVTPAPPTRPPG